MDRKRLNSKKSITAKLARTRKVIQNKFQKAFKQRISREKDLKDKYKPITSAIEKIVDPRGGLEKLVEPHRFELPKRNSHFMSDDSNMPIDSLSSSEHIYDSLGESSGSDMDNYLGPFTDDWTDSENDDEHNSDMEVDPQGPGPSNINKRKLGDNDDAVDVPGVASEIENDVEPNKRVKNKNDTQKTAVIPKQRIPTKVRRKQPAIKKKVRVLRPRTEDDLNADQISSYSEEDDDVLVTTDNRKKRKMVKSVVKAKDKLSQKNKHFKARDLQMARDIREDAKKRAAHLKDVGGIDVIEISDDENVGIIEGRTKPVKRKSYAVEPILEPRKHMSIPLNSADQKRKFLNYGGIKKVPEHFLAKNRFRAKTKQKTPYHIQKVPSIDAPYLTLGHVIHRKYIPPVPDRTKPLVMIVKDKSQTSTKKTKGGGSIETDFIPYNENVTYEYYDNPNELCDRLRLLTASRAAGNSNHAQEINSIIDELRESGYVV